MTGMATVRGNSTPYRGWYCAGCALAAVAAGILLLLTVFNTRPSRPINPLPEEPIHARGHLKLIGHVNLHSQARQMDIKRLLVGRDLAPQAPSLRAGPNTPPLPKPQAGQWGLEYASVAADSISAVLMNRSDDEATELVIHLGSKARYTTVTRPLLRMGNSGGALVPYAGGRGLFVLVTYQSSRGYSTIRSAGYWAGAPEWKVGDAPELPLQPRKLKVAGQTVDGSMIYVAEGRYAAARLWLVDTAQKSIREVPLRSGQLSGDCKILPSPDRQFLLSAGDPWRSRGTRQGLELVNVCDGKVSRLTWRQRGDYADSGLGWSASAPGRVYFVDALGNVWQLDVDLSLVTTAKA